jgi:hypothetical protein
MPALYVRRARVFWKGGGKKEGVCLCAFAHAHQRGGPVSALVDQAYVLVDQAYVCRRTERTRRTRRTRVCLKLELDAVRACCPVWPVWDSAVRMIGSA